MRLAIATAALLLLLAAPAAAWDESIRVNEISVAENRVELLDVLPESDSFDEPEGYFVRSYDGVGNELASREFLQPVSFSFADSPVVIELALPAGAGQVCFEKGRGEFDASPAAAFRMHCIGYGQVTNPVVRRMYIYAARIAMPVAPAPGPEQSVQRQACGRAGLASPTLGAKNAGVPSVCADSSPLCDDPTSTLARAKLTLKLPRSHDVDRPFFVRATLSNNGRVSMRGSYFAQLGPIPPTDPRNPQPLPGSFTFGPIERAVRAGVTIRVRIPISTRAKALVKRAARRGKETRGSLVTVGQGRCERVKWHSSRQFKLVP
jgi:hypothetical protein